MNCWQGYCKYRINKYNLCKLDKEKDKIPKRCDMYKNLGKEYKCRYGYLGCKNYCIYYDICDKE